MGKKIITFLGTGNYEETIYEYTIKESGKKIKTTTRFVQEAVYEIAGDDAILYVALTEDARKTNWIDQNISIRDRVTGEEKEVFLKGLKPILDNKGIKYKDFSLKDGKNEKEIWENFESIFTVLEEGDEVYIDVTHSFRSIPIIMMSVLNYAKFIKNVTIKAIFYGAFEARVDDITPIFDLSLFSTITDWTMGAEKFINSGDSRQLTAMIDETIRPILKETKGKNETARISREISKDLETFSGALFTARGNKISEYGIALKRSLELIKTVEVGELKPFEMILEEIYKKVHFYSDDIVKDVHNTVKLCRDLNLIQQSYTFLQENIINHFCIVGDMDLISLEYRSGIPEVIMSRHKYLKRDIGERHLHIEEKIGEYVTEDIANLYNQLGDFRNDINHAGYRDKSKKSERFVRSLDDFICEFEKLILN